MSVFSCFGWEKYFDFGKFQKTRLSGLVGLVHLLEFATAFTRRCLLDAGSPFCGVAVSHPLQRTRADDMSHDVDQSDTAPVAAAALMRERVRIPLP